MQLIAVSKSVAFPNKSGTTLIKKTWLIMKMTIVLLTIACLQLSAKGYTQSVTLTVKNATLEKVFQELKKQTGYDFWYESKLLQNAKKVTLEIKNSSLEYALDQCFRDQPFTYSIVEKIIVVKLKPQTGSLAVSPIATGSVSTPPLLIDISGTITDDKGQPLAGATILVKGTPNGTKSDANGTFSINAAPNSTLIISFVGFESTEVAMGSRTNVTIQLKPLVSLGDEVVVIGYGTQKRSSVTASISKIENDKLDQIPTERLENAIIGRMAGVNITTQHDRPGEAPEINIRGYNSISAGNSPLIVIDGVPGGNLGSLNMNDVQSIEVLKDASSAAIYGSRGAGGVVLVTTKR
ncbi:MAG: TonB-dependent receptor plug domain-containing protein, partial [Ginsengibacter sp.]